MQAIGAVFDLNTHDAGLEAVVMTTLGAIHSAHAVPIGPRRIPNHEILGPPPRRRVSRTGDGTAVDVLIRVAIKLAAEKPLE